MTVEWGEYEPFDPGVTRPLHEVSRREARAAFTRIMALKSFRIEQLRELLRRNGVELASSDDGLKALNEWFVSEVEGDPSSGRLLPVWYSVVNDIALFLGDEIIQRCESIYWAFFEKGAKDAAFQRHVLMGFSKVANPKYNVDIDLLLAAYAHQTIAGHYVEHDVFLTWVQAAVLKA